MARIPVNPDGSRELAARSALVSSLLTTSPATTKTTNCFAQFWAATQRILLGNPTERMQLQPNCPERTCFVTSRYYESTDSLPTYHSRATHMEMFSRTRKLSTYIRMPLYLTGTAAQLPARTQFVNSASRCLSYAVLTDSQRPSRQILACLDPISSSAI